MGDAGNSEESLHAERFAAVYRELSPRVLGYLRVHGVDDPESVTQDVFLALYPRLPAVTGGEDGVRTLTFSIAHARIVDFHRAAARRPGLVVLDPETDPRRVPSAEDVHTALAEGRSTLALLERLGDDQREAVSLRIIAELSLAEAAEVMGRSVGAVKQLQRRGLEALRDLVTKEASHD
ncbi:RNA polymerase sigma factor [Lysinimonas soli]|uniref:RNA polymerase sigma factor n=1 Tax=Lysinimonas soli TaxID=1074233 RepID=A0ABW0NSQ9_9MICO